tara:strand:+ start:53 stop:550 length:498 start_codon:yes stop_codon:yes gene_type:complete
MPQLEQTEFFISQLFWLVLTFSFLLIFLWRISLPRISSVLERRENKINNDIETAKQQQIEAEEIQSQIEKQILDARNQGLELIKESQEKMQKKTTDQLKIVDDELSKKLNEASSIIENNKKETFHAINNQVYEITKLILLKLTPINVTDDEIKSSISNISQKKIN